MDKSKAKLSKFLKDNQKWPIVLVGIDGGVFSQSVVVPATISTTQLGMYTDDNGTLCPEWAVDLKKKSQNDKRVILCIDNLDSVDFEEQEKFCSLLKHKGINGFEFPKNIQIVLTAKSNNISEKIKALTILYEI